MRRILVSICLLLAIALPCQAQGDKAKPNTLSAKEIADGWILLFDGETTFGWKVKHSSTKQTPKVADGILDIGDMGSCYVGTTSPLMAFEVRFEYLSTSDGGMFGLQQWTAKTSPSNSTSLELLKHDQWTPVSVRVADGSVQDDRGGQKNVNRLAWNGLTEIQFGQNPRTKLKVRNLKLRPLNTKPLFNGKDLTGWKEFPGKKSKFTVTDGAITVINGPGDLQTTGKYQDFVLQLECKSNGKHLNSGIFFRCKDNEYQNGYEAQIFNKFTPEATQDYTVEEYDPKTNKLLAKNKIKSTAVDFGTGAIYRRVPARKEMSKDGEWFGMTIVAHGNHLATWVNGVQVVDWHDNRPKNDNPRTGYRAEAGHISIQGHDPTTNLSFKNFRIAELPTGK